MSELTRRDAVRLVAAGAAVAVGTTAAMAQDKAAPKKAEFTKADMDTYNKVAEVIGLVMDGAYKEIIAKLASGKAKDIKVAGFADGVKVTDDELAVFFSLARTTGIELMFAPKTAKVLIGRSFDTTDIPIDKAVLKDTRISGEISVNLGIRF